MAPNVVAMTAPASTALYRSEWHENGHRIGAGEVGGDIGLSMAWDTDRHDGAGVTAQRVLTSYGTTFAVR